MSFQSTVILHNNNIIYTRHNNYTIIIMLQYKLCICGHWYIYVVDNQLYILDTVRIIFNIPSRSHQYANAPPTNHQSLLVIFQRVLLRLKWPCKKHHNNNNYLISIVREGVKLHAERVCVSVSHSFAYFLASLIASYVHVILLHGRPAASN